jgi:hypothetical protein
VPTQGSPNVVLLAVNEQLVAEFSGHSLSVTESESSLLQLGLPVESLKVAPAVESPATGVP